MGAVAAHEHRPFCEHNLALHYHIVVVLRLPEHIGMFEKHFVAGGTVGSRHLRPNQRLVVMRSECRRSETHRGQQ